MALTKDDYLRQLQALLPPGPAWPRDLQSLLSEILDAFAEEYSLVDQRIEDLLDEADPRTTLELLSDWERVAGLPDTCTGPLSSVAARRDALVARLTQLGGQSRQYFIDLAAALGYTITITEFRPYTVGSQVNDPLCSEEWRFVWQVNAAQDTVRKFRVTSGVDEALASWGNTLLECAISRLKPAHTIVQFAYS